MTRRTRKTSKQEKGITLIALIVTIIVLLILAGVTINLAVNNQGIFNKAKTATRAYKNASEGERTGLDEADKEIAKYMPKEGSEGGSSSGSETTGNDPLKNTDRTIDNLNKDEGDSNKDGVVDTKDDLRGFYIDLDGDGELNEANDGVIYGDLFTGGEGLYYCHTLEGIDTLSEEERAQFIQQMNDYCKYKIPRKSTLSTYEIIKDSNGNIKKFDGPFGSRGMIQRKTAVTNGDRFYVLALADFDSNSHCWYNTAGNMTDYATYTSTSFGSGKENTSKMITAWNNKKYGEQNGNSFYSDVWGVIQDKANAGWFIPSRDEWNAFGAFFKVGGDWCKLDFDGNEHAFTDYYDYNTKYKLSEWCWSSSQSNTDRAYIVGFHRGDSTGIPVLISYSVRLGSTF